MQFDDIDYSLLRVVCIVHLKFEVRVFCVVGRERCVTILRCIPASRLNNCGTKPGGPCSIGQI
jgi:hypothetical protein